MTRELKERRESREDLGAKCPAFLWFYLEEAELEVCRLENCTSHTSLLTAR